MPSWTAKLGSDSVPWFHVSSRHCCHKTCKKTKSTCLPTYLHTCLPVPANLPTCLPAHLYLPTCLTAHLPTCLPALPRLPAYLYLPTHYIVPVAHRLITYMRPWYQVQLEALLPQKPAPQNTKPFNRHNPLPIRHLPKIVKSPQRSRMPQRMVGGCCSMGRSDRLDVGALGQPSVLTLG